MFGIMRTKVVRKYHPFCGTWWEIWVKVFFFWIKSPYVFDTCSGAKAAQSYGFRDLFEKPVKTIVSEQRAAKELWR